MVSTCCPAHRWALPFSGEGTNVPVCRAHGRLSPGPRVSTPGRGLGRPPHAFQCILDVEAFAKAMQNSARSEPKEGDGKDKKDEEEDMSLD